MADLFKEGMVKFQAPDKTILMEGTVHGQLFDMAVKPISKHDQAYPAKKSRTWDEWHRIFGHMTMGSIKMLKGKGMVTGMEVDADAKIAEECKACIMAKQHVTPFPKESHTEIAEIRDLTVCDVWGPACTQSIGGDRYFIMFTDGKSRRTMMYFMKEKV